jgi:hypothetical protein
MQRFRLSPYLALAALAFPSNAVSAQEPDAPVGGTIGVFLDCHARYCDFDHFRREISFVNWMRDRQDADVHLLITMDVTGGGGYAYTFTFIGLRDFAAQEDTLRYTSSADDTQAEVRDALTQTIKLGLIPFIAGTAVADQISIGYEAPAVALVTGEDAVHDPWNYWVFRLSVGGSAAAESQQRDWQGDASFRANRTTEALKLTLRSHYFGSREEFDGVDEETGQDTTIVGIRTFWNVDLLSAWTLTDHWSAGAMAELEHSSTRNTEVGGAIGPSIEYNIYPWIESTRRQIAILYTIGVAGFQYMEETIFGVTSEWRPMHLLDISSEFQQPWGSIDVSLEAFQYLNDLELHSVELDGGFNIRIFRGLEFGVFGSIARVKDQIYLPAEEATPEEILLRLQQRGTDFFFRLHFNISYRFGSKFNNVVNPRMRGGF